MYQTLNKSPPPHGTFRNVDGGVVCVLEQPDAEQTCSSPVTSCSNAMNRSTALDVPLRGRHHSGGVIESKSKADGQVSLLLQLIYRSDRVLITPVAPGVSPPMRSRQIRKSNLKSVAWTTCTSTRSLSIGLNMERTYTLWPVIEFSSSIEKLCSNTEWK